MLPVLNRIISPFVTGFFYRHYITFMALHCFVCVIGDSWFLNQARTWFLRIGSVRESMRVCVCVSAPEAINNFWCDIDPIRLVE